MVADIEIRAKKPELNDLSPQVFFASIFIVTAVVSLFINIFLSFIFGFVALIFGMLILTRVSQPLERIVVKNGLLIAYRGEKKLWQEYLTELSKIDIDTYSEYECVRGQTMIVFNLNSGDSFSMFYTNYTRADLTRIKNVVDNKNH